MEELVYVCIWRSAAKQWWYCKHLIVNTSFLLSYFSFILVSYLYETIHMINERI